MPRDYHKEYQNGSTKVLTLRLQGSKFADFRSVCSDNGITQADFLKACIDAYLDNSLTYENGKLRMN